LEVARKFDPQWGLIPPSVIVPGVYGGAITAARQTIILSLRGGGGVVNQLGGKETDAVRRREVALFRIDKGISMTFTKIFDVINREKISDAFRTRIKCAPPLAARSWTTAAPTPDVPPWHLELQPSIFMEAVERVDVPLLS